MTMAKMLLSIILVFCCGLTAKANDIVLSKTGNTQLDGIYKPFVERNGAMSFIKNTEGVTYTIARFEWQVGEQATVFGWLISDSNNKEYYAVTEQNTQIPSQGWDIARAGVGLNANFELTFSDSINDQVSAFTLTNTPALDIKVYPNPTLGEITVSAKEDIQNLTLTNMAGQVLLTGQNNRLDLTTVPSGVYNLEIQPKDGRNVKRIVKQ